MTRIRRLRALADSCERDYLAGLSAGGEPNFPEWISDLRDVCKLAELADAWDTAHCAGRTDALIAFRSHMKAMRGEP